MRNQVIRARYKAMKLEQRWKCKKLSCKCEKDAIMRNSHKHEIKLQRYKVTIMRNKVTNAMNKVKNLRDNNHEK